MNLKKTLKTLGMGSLLICMGYSQVFAHALPGVSVGKVPDKADDLLIGAELHTFYRADFNPYFGASGLDTHGVDRKNTNWGEMFARIYFSAYRELDWANVSLQIAPYYATTAGQDVYGLAKDDEEVGLDQGWLEFDQLFGAPVTVKVGTQDVQIEKWFIMGSSWNQSVAGWLFNHYSFPFAVKADAALGPVNATAFYARPGGNRQPGGLDVLGANLHWNIMEGTYLYGGVYRQLDREDTNNEITVWDIGGETTFAGFTLEGEYAIERGDAGDLDREATAFFAAATYNFPVALNPYVRAMYVSYSGDDDPTDNTVKDWDQFFDGFSGWNRWIQGEQTGEIWLGNSNKQVIIGEAGFTPTETTMVSFHYLNHTIAEKESFGTTSDDWGDEINLFVDSMLSEELLLHVGGGAMFPGDAAKEVTGSDDTAYFGQVWMMFKI